jgi:DNA-binding protein H-NS
VRWSLFSRRGRDRWHGQGTRQNVAEGVDGAGAQGQEGASQRAGSQPVGCAQEEIIAEAGFKVSDIFGGRGGKGRTVAAKYANPDNPSETWTGRGRKPRWLTAKLQEGGKIEKYLIK